MNRLLPYFGGLLVALLATMVCTHARAEVRVPVQLQAQLVSRLGTFDRNFKTRAGSLARVLVVRRAGNGESKSVGAIFARALVELGQVGGVPASVEEIDYPDPTTLATRCRTSQVALVYFSVGLEPEMRAVASALVGVDVLTVGASAQHAINGAVVGFDLEEARPKIVLNRKSEHAQNVEFKAELLKLARIVE